MNDAVQVPDRLTLMAFSGAVIFGGLNFVAVRFSNRELDPFFGAGLRFASAAVLLIVFVTVRRVAWPRGRVLAVSIAYGVLAFTLTYALAYWALQELSAGIGAVVFGATPLLTILLASVHRLERFTARGMAGALLALVGIVVLADPWSADRLPLLPLLAILGAAAGAAESSVILKLVPPTHPASTNAVAMAVGAVALLVLSASVSETWVAPGEQQTWIALAYLIVFGSVGLFGLILFTLARWTASAVAYITALFPVVAMVGGAVIAGEEITLQGVLGGLIVITGVYVGALRPVRRTPVAAG